jgi:hypothetical protein
VFIEGQKKSLNYQVVFLIISIIMLFVNRQEAEDLFELQPHFKLFIGIDLVLYVAFIGWFYFAKATINAATFGVHKCLFFFIILAGIVNA